MSYHIIEAAFKMSTSPFKHLSSQVKCAFKANLQALLTLQKVATTATLCLAGQACSFLLQYCCGIYGKVLADRRVRILTEPWLPIARKPTLEGEEAFSRNRSQYILQQRHCIA